MILKASLIDPSKQELSPFGDWSLSLIFSLFVGCLLPSPTESQLFCSFLNKQDPSWLNSCLRVGSNTFGIANLLPGPAGLLLHGGKRPGKVAEEHRGENPTWSRGRKKVGQMLNEFHKRTCSSRALHWEMNQLLSFVHGGSWRRGGGIPEKFTSGKKICFPWKIGCSLQVFTPKPPLWWCSL